MPNQGSLKIRTFWSGSLTGKQDYTSPIRTTSLDGRQITVSENHPGWRSRSRGRFSGDFGGNFSSVRTECDSIIPVHLISGHDERFWPATSTTVYRGPLLPAHPSDLPFPPNNSSSVDNLYEKGAKAIARCAPTNPTIDLSTFLGELAGDGIPHVAGSFLKGLRGMLPGERRKALSGEYLNYQFGWRPFVSDLKGIAHRIVDGDAAYRQYLRDSGKLVRRRYSFPPEHSEKTEVFMPSTYGPWYLPSSSGLDDQTYSYGKVMRSETIDRKIWFSGAFTYYIPPPDNWGTDSVARQVIWAKKSLGLRLTPDSVWNLMPWSWAIDWFSDVGDVLKNLDAWIIDNQVLAYGYIMETVVTKWTYTYVGPTGLQGAPLPTPVTLTTTSKLRLKATPYGFGIDLEALSGFQKSIIAALGFNRGRKRH